MNFLFAFTVGFLLTAIVVFWVSFGSYFMIGDPIQWVFLMKEILWIGTTFGILLGAVTAGGGDDQQEPHEN